MRVSVESVDLRIDLQSSNSTDTFLNYAMDVKQFVVRSCSQKSYCSFQANSATYEQGVDIHDNVLLLKACNQNNVGLSVSISQYRYTFLGIVHEMEPKGQD